MERSTGRPTSQYLNSSLTEQCSLGKWHLHPQSCSCRSGDFSGFERWFRLERYLWHGLWTEVSRLRLACTWIRLFVFDCSELWRRWRSWPCSCWRSRLRPQCWEASWRWGWLRWPGWWEACPAPAGKSNSSRLWRCCWEKRFVAEWILFKC